MREIATGARAGSNPSGNWLAFMLAAAFLVAIPASPVLADDPAISTSIKSMQLVGYRPGTAPPSFDGMTPAGTHIALASLHGKVVILNFWASWCADCRPEMPALERLHRDFASRGLVILGVNAREDAAMVQRFAKELALTFPVIVDADGRINTLYGVVGVPATFVIARDGRAIAFAV